MLLNSKILAQKCRVPELFRLSSKLGCIVQDMKLNKTKVRYIIRQNCKRMPTKEIAWDVKVSQRRVQQIIREYKETGQEPVLGEKVGRPRKPFTEKETEVIRAAHARYRFGARMLETVILYLYRNVYYFLTRQTSIQIVT